MANLEHGVVCGSGSESDIISGFKYWLFPSIISVCEKEWRNGMETLCLQEKAKHFPSQQSMAEWGGDKREFTFHGGLSFSCKPKGKGRTFGSYEEIVTVTRSSSFLCGRGHLLQAQVGDHPACKVTYHRASTAWFRTVVLSGKVSPIV